MRVSEFLDEIELLVPSLPVDKGVLRQWMSSELNEITGKEDFNWAMRHLDPAVSTTTGKRNYPLPLDFPENFVGFAGERGEDYCCKLDNGSSESLMVYVSPVQFYSGSLRSESNGTPGKYTILSASSGRKEIVLSPPPDSNSSTYYTIDGLYVPTDWKLQDEDAVPPLPGNSTVLKYGVLRRLVPQQYEPLYREALAALYLKAARNRASQAIPMQFIAGSAERRRSGGSR